MHRCKIKLKNIKTKERMFWQASKKTAGSVMRNAFLNIRSTPEGILKHLWRPYIAYTECKGCYNLICSFKVFRENFVSVLYVYFSRFLGLGKISFHYHDMIYNVRIEGKKKFPKVA